MNRSLQMHLVFVATVWIWFPVMACLTHAEDDATTAIFDGAPAVPSGYSSEIALKTAYALGQVELVVEPKEIPSEITEYKDIEYARIGEQALTMNIYVPQAARDSTPCLLFIHGGGWRKGKKEDYLFYNLAFAKQGYVTATVQYRLSDEAKFPAAVHDVKAAVRWLRAHAEDYRIAPNQIVALGGSAGGHLALMLGLSSDKQLEGDAGNLEFSSRVQAVVNFYGVTDLTTEKAKAAHQVTDFIGGKYEDFKHAYHLASPIDHVSPDDPPVLSFHGTLDSLVPVSQAIRLHEKLDSVGVENWLDVVEGWPHSMDRQVDVNKRCRYIISRFLSKHVPLN